MPHARRSALRSMLAAGAALLAFRPFAAEAVEAGWNLPDAQWRKRLSPQAYDVLRRAGTEAPFTSPLLNEHRKGLFLCGGCGLGLFASATKYDSGTGWPSFWKPLDHAIETRADHALFESRTEVHCRRCGGHLGHVFDDGPRPTGLRYCMNGVALGFRAGAGK